MEGSRAPSNNSSRSITPSQGRGRSWLRTFVHLIVWLELMSGLSVILSSVMLNPRIPAFLFGMHGAYIAIFLWMVYTTYRSAYLNTELNHLYLIFLGCTIVSFGVVAYTLFTAPNSGEIGVIALGLFLVGLVLFPLIAAGTYCYIRGNFLMPNYTKGKLSQQPGA